MRRYFDHSPEIAMLPAAMASTWRSANVYFNGNDEFCVRRATRPNQASSS
jgi:hypothetical protein